MSRAAPLILGTAQFGTAYGITNERGRLSSTDIDEILRLSQAEGVTTIDTARAYGDAEVRVGEAISGLGGTWHAITKIVLDDVQERSAIEVVDEAKHRLKCDTLTVLLHRPADVLDARLPVLLDQLRDARASGRIEGFGVSVYDHVELQQAVRAIPDLAIVQIPGSLVDRRLIDTELVAELAHAGVEIHVRSVFLQGLLLAAPAQLSPEFAPLAPVLQQVDAIAAESGVTRLALLLHAVRSHPAVSGVVVGAASAQEWGQIIRAAPLASESATELPVLEEDILDPRRWRA